MYTSYIGKKFLILYRDKFKKPEDYSARQFFDEVLFPLFFDDEKHLLHVGNSPFFQKPKDEDVKIHGTKSLAQYNNLVNAIENESPSMAIYVGFAAKDMEGTTSGQLTSMDFRTSSEDMYSSWIGESLGIGVSGGFVMLIDKEDILLSLFQGWQYYRKYLVQTPSLKDKQIETWNGHWLSHSFSKHFNLIYPMDNFKLETAEVQGNVAIPTHKWSQLIFSLSQKYPGDIVTAYCYNLSQTNTTLGFINLYLPDIRRFYELRDKLFLHQNDSILNNSEIETLETFYNFKSACKFGTIGLKAFEPAKLREFMPKGSVEFAQGKDFKFIDKDSYLFYQLYKLWIIAMLNKTELLQLASDTAKSLIDLENNQTERDKSKTTQNQSSKELMDSKNIKSFIDGLTGLIKTENADIFKAVVEQILKMPSDNFPLFITLIRFEYAFLKSKN